MADKVQEVRRIKKLIEYHQGAADAFAHVIVNINLDDSDIAYIEEKIEHNKDKIEHYLTRLRTLPKDD